MLPSYSGRTLAGVCDPGVALAGGLREAAYSPIVRPIDFRPCPAASKFQKQLVFFQVAVEQRADREIDAKPRRDVPDGRVVGQIRLDGAGDDRMDDVRRQGILTEDPKQAELPAPRSQIRTKSA